MATKSQKNPKDLVRYHPPGFEKHDYPFGIDSRYWWIIFLPVFHALGLYYFLYLLPFGHVPRGTFLLAAAFTYVCGLGVTIGEHRYWTHRAFKAKLPLQILLLICQSMTFHKPIITFCIHHRVHHKYTDTDADPHNSMRGFWFSHVGWLVLPKHPKCVEKLRSIDVSDLVADPIVRFQSDYYYLLSLIFALAIPMGTCKWIYPEMTLLQLLAWKMGKLCATMNASFCVNSFAHMFGDKPYDKNLKSTDNKWISMLAIGEGWHNYHHTFPWDYKAAELGRDWNLSTQVIDFFAWIGWAYDLKTASKKTVVDRIKRTGDGTHSLSKSLIREIETNSDSENHNVGDYVENDENESTFYWNWGDEDLKSNAVETTKVKNCAG